MRDVSFNWEDPLCLDELLSAEIETIPELSNAIGRHYFNLTDDAPHRVLTRAERIKTLQEQEKWTEGRSPFNLPKVRVQKIVIKKAKKEKAAEGEDAKAADKK